MVSFQFFVSMKFSYKLCLKAITASRVVKSLLGLLLISFVVSKSFAQYTPLKTQYFINPYLGNPAMAGSNGLPEMFLDYSNQWNKMDGTPQTFAFSTDVIMNDKVGLGVSLVTETAGIFKQTSAMGSFSYKLTLTDISALRFGVSLTMGQDRVSFDKATPTGALDPQLVSYNNTYNHLDGNFGATYQLKNFEAQFSYLGFNGNRYSLITTLGKANLFSAVSYKFVIDSDIVIKPLIAFRDYKDLKGVMDVAVEWQAQQLRFYTMYHTNNSFTGGISYFDKTGFIFSAMHNTGPRILKGMTGGVFDIGIGMQF